MGVAGRSASRLHRWGGRHLSSRVGVQQRARGARARVRRDASAGRSAADARCAAAGAGASRRQRTEGAGMTGSSEVARKMVHLGMGSLAFLLKYLTPWQAAGCAGFALAFNFFVLPRVDRGM